MNEKVARVGNWVIFVLSLPGVVLGWLVVVLALALFFAHKPKLGPYGVITAVWRPWWANIWKYSTTFSYGFIMHPRVADDTPGIIDHRVEKHEMVHVRQSQDRTILALVLALVVFLVTWDWGLALCIWGTGPLWQLPNFLTATLRGGHVYRDTEHERSAYAQCSSLDSDGRSWLDRHLEKDRKW